MRVMNQVDASARNMEKLRVRLHFFWVRNTLRGDDQLMMLNASTDGVFGTDRPQFDTLTTVINPVHLLNQTI
jgi:hypothetical protein